MSDILVTFKDKNLWFFPKAPIDIDILLLDINFIFPLLYSWIYVVIFLLPFNSF